MPSHLSTARRSISGTGHRCQGLLCRLETLKIHADLSEASLQALAAACRAVACLGMAVTVPILCKSVVGMAECAKTAATSSPCGSCFF